MNKKCTICKQTTARIFYGMPNMTIGMMKQMEKEELVLGGCCVSGNDPVYKCISCSIVYWTGGLGQLVEIEAEESESISLNSICSFCKNHHENGCEAFDDIPVSVRNGFEFHLDTMFGQNGKCVFEPNPNFKGVAFELSIGGYGGPDYNVQYLDGILSLHYSEGMSFPSEVQGRNVFILSKKQKLELKRCIVNGKWRTGYMNHEILDGTQWSYVQFNGQKKTNSWGSNKYPKAYKFLLNVLNQILEPTQFEVG